MNTIKLKYNTVERFLLDYGQLQTGSLALPVKSPLPLNTRILLEFSIPKIVPPLILKGTVTKTFDDPGSAGLQNSGIIQIGFNGNLRNAVSNFNKVLLNHKKYRVLIETAELVSHVRANLRSYVKNILQLKSTEDALVLIRQFRRVLPDLIQQADWSTVLHLTRAVDRTANTTEFFAAASDLPANPLESVFENHVRKIIKGYATANAAQREMIHEIAGCLDATGIEIMAKILSDYTEKNDTVRHYRKIVQLIKALESASAVANRAEVESIILSLVRKLSYRNKWLFRRLKNTIEPAQADVLSAAITALGKIGTDKSESFLEQLADSNSPQAEPAQAAANHIRLRCIARLSDAPADGYLSALA